MPRYDLPALAGSTFLLAETMLARCASRSVDELFCKRASQAPAGDSLSFSLSLSLFPGSHPRVVDVVRLACCSSQYTRVIKYGGLGVDLARPADQDLYLTQLPSYEYRDLVTTE